MTSMPEFIDGKVRAVCPGCGGEVGTFLAVTARAMFPSMSPSSGNTPIEVGNLDPAVRRGASYRLLECTMCGEVAMAKVVLGEGGPRLAAFYPHQLVPARLPEGVPEGVVLELREGELCASAGAFRAGVMMLRSALEKVLGANGYTKKRDGDLKARIDAAARDGAMTTSDARGVHDDVREQGNAIVHDDWRDVTAVEWKTALDLLVRIVDCLYGRRETARALLIDRKRISADGQSVACEDKGVEEE